MASRIPVKISKKTNDSNASPNHPKLSETSKPTKRNKPDRGPWSFFSKRPATVSGTENAKPIQKPLHPLGQIPAYLRKRSKTFTKETTQPKVNDRTTSAVPEAVEVEVEQDFSENLKPKESLSKEQILTDLFERSATFVIDKDSKPLPANESRIESDYQSNIEPNKDEVKSLKKTDSENKRHVSTNTVENFSSDVEHCAEFRKTLEEQIDQLFAVVKDAKVETQLLNFLDSTVHMPPFRDAVTTCKEFYDSQNHKILSKNTQSQVEQEDLRNVISTISHLEFKSSQQRTCIRTLDRRSKRYRCQVAKLQECIRQYEDSNRKLGEEIRKQEVVKRYNAAFLMAHK